MSQLNIISKDFSTVVNILYFFYIYTVSEILSKSKLGKSNWLIRFPNVYEICNIN